MPKCLFIRVLFCFYPLLSFFVFEKKLCKLGNCYVPEIVRWKGLNQCNGLVQTFPQADKVGM